MKSLQEIVNDNLNEAIDILQEKGGHFVFCDALKQTEVSELETQATSISVKELELLKLPRVILANDENIYEVFVVAVRINDDPFDVEFLCYDLECRESFWTTHAACCNYSENDVYLYLEAQK